jgi:UDP-N-acetylmuramoyl-tripeptide--D-alanyl-D-alanine ligase
MKSIFLILWAVVFCKKLFFWSWLWQLKEYHPGRLKAHFQTYKGKKIVINNLLFAKILLIFGLLLCFDLFLYFLFLVIFLEAVFVFKHIFRKDLKVPVLTKKTILILGTGLLLELLIIISVFVFKESYFYLYLLVLDLLAPFIFSSVVFIFELITMLWRKLIIKKATQKRSKFNNLLVIGITGSYGKTSTKEFLSYILSRKFKVLKTKKHQNSEVGIARCILNELRPDHQIFVCEMGAYNKGGIKLLAGMAKPKIGILTGLNEQHLATFGSFENIIKTKYELIDGLPNNGFAVFNGENNYCRELYEKTEIDKILADKENYISDIKIEKDFISFSMKDNGKTVYFRINLIGEYWIEDILMAILTAQKLGVSLREIAEACGEIKPMPGAMKFIRNNNLNLLDATYSANFNGVMAHLDHIKKWSGKKIIVMPCLIELGKRSNQAHQRIGKKIGQVCDFAIITTKEFFEDIKNEAINSGMEEKNVLFLNNAEDILNKINVFSNNEDVILLESRVPYKLLKFLGIK